MHLHELFEVDRDRHAAETVAGAEPLHRPRLSHSVDSTLAKNRQVAGNARARKTLTLPRRARRSPSRTSPSASSLPCTSERPSGPNCARLIACCGSAWPESGLTGGRLLARPRLVVQRWASTNNAS